MEPGLRTAALLVILSLVFAAGIPVRHAAASAELIDRIVAVVNGEVITLTDLKEAKAKMGLRMETPQFLETEGQPASGGEDREVLKQLIERRLQIQAARKRGIAVTPEETDQFVREIRATNGLQDDVQYRNALAKQGLTPEEYSQDAGEQLMILKLAAREAKEGILLDEKELLDYYQKEKESFRLADGYRLRQILLKVEDPALEDERMQAARDLVARLRGGEDFEQLAGEDSEGPEAADGGLLGFVQKGHMLPEIEKAVASLPDGGISDPVRTAAGIHIFKVDEIRKGAYRPFEEVKADVRDRVYREHVARRYQEWLNDIRSQADVEILF